MILVTVGTEQYPFNALMNWIDVLIREGLIDRNEEVVVQYGSSTKLPDRVKVFKRLPESEFKALLEQARVVISHCGEGSILLLESLGKPYVLVPRMQCFGEHVDDHQLEMADAMEKQGIPVAKSPGDLVRFLTEPKATKLRADSEDTLCEFLSNSYDCNKYKKIMVVCSSGGHFKYAQSLKPFLEQYQDISWVTFRKPDTESQLQADKKRVYWAHSPTNRNLPNLIRNLILAFKVLNHEQPDLVISTGAGIAVPFLLLAKFVYKKTTVFIESKSRIEELSLSAKILYYLSSFDQLVVRSKKINNNYSKAQYISICQTVLPAFELQKKQPIKVNDTAILSTPAHLGCLETSQFKNDFQKLCELGSKKIILDMSSTKWISSAGLGALVNSLKTANAMGIKLVLWSVNSQVMSILSMTKLKNIFTIDGATSAIRNQSANKPNPQVKPSYSIHNLFPRILDIVLGLIGIFLTAIFLIPIGICIKLDSPGPIFDKQIRYGMMGKYFRTWKFRSTVTKAVAGDGLLCEITKFGYFLRKTHLDNLPLFWNVLVGDMSLVGPKASTVDEIDCDSLAEWKALEVKPGMISEWKAHHPFANRSVTPRSNQQNACSKQSSLV